MDLYLVIVLLIIVIAVLCVQLIKKKHLDNAKLKDLDQAVLKAQEDYSRYKSKIKFAQDKLVDLNNERNGCKTSIEVLQEEIKRLDDERKNKKASMTQEIEEDYNRLLAAKSELYKRKQQDYDTEMRELIQEANNSFDKAIQEQNDAIQKLKTRYDGIIEPLQRIEREQETLKENCLDISDDIKKDIAFLLNEVAPKMHDKDIVAKLIWTSYIQKPMQNLMARLNIEDEPGIYKITNINNKKCYIGKSVTLRQRLINHVKGACGISSISDQEIHRAMAHEGIWNFSFEKVCSCSKDDLNEMEKFYISTFKGEEYGYNKTSGG